MKSKGRKSSRETWLNKYGMSLEAYNDMLESQGGSCAICKTAAGKFQKSLCVDHDHETGEVRGLLCNSCNWGLGYFRDRPRLLAQALVYLESAKKGYE
jgi:hypothetical protein